MIRFLLNNTPVAIEACLPDLTLLEYLRERAKLTGTKEGCASGDCGACTVVIAELAGSQLEYRSCNACITLLGAVHGKQVITVEGLATRNPGEPDTLHPVQQAMVDQHASQCGFCTPGIVMSIYALQCNNSQPDPQAIAQALAGNLCRCTGYRPILNAVQALQTRLHESPPENRPKESQQRVIRQLQVMQSIPRAELSQPGRYFHIPSSSAELAALIQRYPRARLLAGGTDLALEVTQQLGALDQVIYLGAIEEMCVLEEPADYLHIGAAVTYTRALASIGKYYPALAAIIERLGALQIRNQGTLGGNIANASPIGDMPPALLALRARLLLSDGRQQRSLPLDEFFIAYRKTALHPGEFIVRIELPKPAAQQQFYLYKVSKRFEDDISAVCMAIAIRLEAQQVRDIRIACGGMAATPQLAPQTMAALSGECWNESSIHKAQVALAKDFTPLSDVRASAAYRLKVAQNLLQRCYLESTGRLAVQVMAHA